MNENFASQISEKSDEELLHIFKRPEEYQSSYIELVEKELQKREVNHGQIKVELDRIKSENIHRNQILDELVKDGEPGDPVFITLGFISAILGGLLGIVAGYIYSNSKRTSLSGAKYYAYDKRTRDFGSAMMIIGIVVLLFSVLYRILPE
jgi:hypothetical protein